MFTANMTASRQPKPKPLNSFQRYAIDRLPGAKPKGNWITLDGEAIHSEDEVDQRRAAMTLEELRATVEPLTRADLDSMIKKPGLVICRHAQASIILLHDKWVMSGPSGRHAIAADSPLDRVNAHWQSFAAHPANQPEQTDDGY